MAIMANTLMHPSPAPAGAAITPIELLFGTALACLGSRSELCLRVKGRASTDGKLRWLGAGIREAVPARVDVHEHRRQLAVARAVA
ncbi:hypothetical protein ZWY2020_002932 [Hordeum vulgare]|nr:hypothetical protein ZWY2020_002932 [Hordeum vulgare]